MLMFYVGVILGVVFMCIVQSIKKDCTRCNSTSSATICEKCYLEILTENTKLKLQLQTYKSAMCEVEGNILDGHIPRLD